MLSCNPPMPYLYPEHDPALRLLSQYAVILSLVIGLLACIFELLH